MKDELMRLTATGFALSLLALTACSPTGPTLSQGAGLETPAGCAARGGTMQRVGRLQTLQCVVAYADAGKACRSDTDCAGACLAPAGVDVAPGSATAGVCQADSNRFGCQTPVIDGKAGPTLCRD